MSYTYTKEKDSYTAISNLVDGGISGKSDGTNIIYQKGQTPPSEAEIDAELKRMQDEYDSQAYARARQPLYPEIGDQLDDLYKQGAFSADMAAKIKKVKDDNPKG